MFSAGNITEKLRVASFDCRREVVVDLYAGRINFLDSLVIVMCPTFNADYYHVYVLFILIIHSFPAL